MKQILTLILLLLGLGACKNQVSEPTLPDNVESTIVSFSINCQAMDEIVTRALPEEGENLVQDLNVYLFHKRAGLTKHLYITSQTSKFMINLVKGDYDLFVMANIGLNLGPEDYDFTQIKNLLHEITSEVSIETSGSLVMSSHKEITITGPTSIPIELERKVAKVQFNLTIAPSFAPNFIFDKIQVRNAASSVKLFEPSKASNVLNYAPQNILPQFYLLENAQGDNPNITSQQNKNKKNAPQNATYIYIKGTSGGKLVEYFIYLGANNTTDFNIYGNKHYIVDATISGINDIDTRVSTTDLTAIPFASSYNPGETAHSTLTLNCLNNFNNTFYLKYRQLAGNGTVTIGGVNHPQNSNFQFMLPNENTRSIPIAVTTNSTTQVVLEFTVTNQDNLSLKKELKTFFGTPTVTELRLKYMHNSDGTIDVWCESSQPVAQAGLQIHFTYEVNLLFSGVHPSVTEHYSSGTRGISPLQFTTNLSMSTVSTLRYTGSYTDVFAIQIVKLVSATHNSAPNDLTTYQIVY